MALLHKRNRVVYVFGAGALAVALSVSAANSLLAQDTVPAPATSQTTVPVPPAKLTQGGTAGIKEGDKAEPLSPAAKQWARYQAELSLADRGGWVTSLQAKMGIGTEAQEEAQFWYGLNALKLDNARWQELGRAALAKLATDGKSVWKTRARNAQAWLLIQAEMIDTAALTPFKRELTNELAKNERDAGAVETAITLAQIAKRLEDTELALKAIRQAQAIADYFDYTGLYTKADMKNLFDACKQADKIAQAALKGEPDKEPKATFDTAETHRLAGMTKRDPEPPAGGKPLPQSDPKDSPAAEYKQALEGYNWVIQQYPEHPLAELAKVRIAEVEMRTGKLKEASDRLQDFIKADPLGVYRGTAHVLWGDLYLEYYFDGHRAEVEYNAVFKPAEYHAELKKLYRVAGRPFFAPDMTADIKLTTISTDGVDPLAAEALAAADTAKQEALKAAELPEGVDPSWKEALADAHTRLGILAYMRNNLKLADQHFTTSYKLAPDTRFGKGVPSGVLLLAERCRGKVSVLPQHIQRAGGDRVRVALFLATCAMDCGQHERAIAVFQRVVAGEFADATFEHKAYALENIGNAAWAREDQDLAWAAWSQFEKAPWNSSIEAPRAMLGYGCTRFTASQEMADADILKQVFEKYPHSEAASEAMVQYASVLSDTDPEKALVYFNRCQRQYPNSIYKDELPILIERCQEDLDAQKPGDRK